MMSTTQVPECTCPCCGYKLSAATPVEGTHNPRPGDVSVCLNCGHMLQFTDNLSVKSVTEDEFITFPLETQSVLTRVMRLIHLRGPIKRHQ